jgi:excisionase family DNA binding protein
MLEDMQTPIAKREGFYAPKQVADELGLHVSAIYRAVERGDLPSVRLGPRSAIRIPMSAVRPERQP